MRQLTLLGWGILMLSLASFWNLPAQEVVAHIRSTVTDPSRVRSVATGAERSGTASAWVPYLPESAARRWRSSI